MARLLKITDDGKSKITLDFGKAGKHVVDIDSYNADVARYLKLRGGRKYFSDQCAVPKDDPLTPAQALEKCQKADERLKAGSYYRRIRFGSNFSVAELEAIFRRLAPEADEVSIKERVIAIHPDHAKDEKERRSRQRKVREIVNAAKALEF